MKAIIFKLRLLLSVVAVSLLWNVTTAQNTSLPYFNGFENPSDTVGLSFKKRASGTGWAVGSAQHCLGFNSLYLSTDNGASASYGVTASGYVSLAYMPITLPAGTYTLAFDYMMGGDGTNQSMKVAWAPSSVTLSAASMGSAFPNAILQNQFTDSKGQNNYTSAAWSHVTGTISVATAGTYNLCFAFRSSSTTQVPPGACVDNIQIDTVHASTDCVATPSNITVVKDAQHGVIVCWNGNATSYEVVAASASNPDDYSFAVHDGVTTTCDTFQYSELGEGQYFFYVRPICGTDTGMYAETSGHLIYDVSAHCIDFVTFNAPGTQCTYGTYSNPYQTNGYIDNGSSQMSSRHTVNTDLNETDPRTNGALHLVPTGEIMSVRLGNWNNGSEAESITYTYNVPAGSNLILMMKYAVVFEEPGHGEPPEFKLEIMNANNQLLDPVCTKANFLCDGTLTQGWHSCKAQGSTSSLSDIWYKDWTTIGVNLTAYAGQTVKIRLTTYDCNWSGHFGYAYFTLDCSQAEFTGMSCGSGEATEIKAPDGFNYQWTNNCTGQVVSTSQSLPISGTDTCSYTCRCSYKEQTSCYFNLTAYTIPRLPEASFTYSISYSDCQTHITFNNNSFVYILQGGAKVPLYSESLTGQTWLVQSKHNDRPYHNLTSIAKNFPTLDIPKEGDTITITLYGFAKECDDDTTVVIVVPPLQDNHVIVNKSVLKMQPVVFNDNMYVFITNDSLKITTLSTGAIRYVTGQQSIQVNDTLESWYGCDSVATMNLTLLCEYLFEESNAICRGETYYWRGRTLTESGVYYDSLRTSLDLDSIYKLTLTVNPTYLFEESETICHGNSYSWRGRTFYESGVYWDSLVAVSGCDSIFKLTLTVNPAYINDEFMTICQGSSYTWHMQTYSEAGDYYDTLFTRSGCEYIFRLALAVQPTYLFADTLSSYDIDLPYHWHGRELTESGIYYDSLQTVTGCDSIYQLMFIVKPYVCHAPVNLVAALIDNKSFQFDWVNPTLGTEEEQPNNFTYLLSANELDDPGAVEPTKAQRTNTMAQITAALYNTEYHFYVKNVCRGVSSDWAHVAISSISGRPAVDSLHVVRTETSAISIAWKRNKFGTELKWKVDVALASDSSAVKSLVASTTNVRITGLDAETEYIFTVSPRLNSTNFGDAATVNGTTLDKPAMPVNLYGEITANRQVTFYWQNGSEADANNFSYKLSSKYIDANKDKYDDNPDVEGFADTTVTFSNLSYGMTYYFYVRNVRAADGAVSDWALCYVKSNLQNPPVKNIHAEDATPTTLTVAWERGNAASVEPRWIVVMRRESDNQLIDSVNVNVLQATFTGLTRGTDYVVRVYPRLNSKTLGTVASAVLSTEQTCEAPINLTYVNTAYRAYTFSWENPTVGATEVEPNNFTYILVNSAEPINPDSTYPTKRNFTGTSLSVAKLSKGATYYFYVRNEYDGVASAWAGPIVITVPASATSAAAHYENGTSYENENENGTSYENENENENFVVAEAYVNYDKLFVENIVEGSDVMVVDASGRVVYNAKVNDTRMECDLFVRGVYVVVIRGKMEQTLKVVY